jgi:GTPase SAR1 family protein
MPQTETTGLVSRLHCLRQLVDESGDGRLSSRIGDEIQKLQANRFHLVVLGQFKRGKTTFINALLGEELLPVGVVPVTSVVTLIRYGTETRCEVVFSDNHGTQIQPCDLREYVTEQGNPENRKCVRYVEIAYPSKFLEDGIILIDTPGIGSLYVHNTETTKDFIPNVDAAIVVLSADLPITQTEHQFLDEVAAHVDKIFFVLNKIDLLTSAETEDALSYTHRVLTGKLGDEQVSIIPLSARNALLGETAGEVQMVEQSNVNVFKQRIDEFIRSEKQTVLHQRSQDRINRLIAEALFNAELELRAITTPVTDLQAKIDEFGRQMELLKGERENFSYLLQGQIAALNRWIEEQIDQFGSGEIKRLKDVLTQWAEHNPALSGKEFQKEIQSKLSSTLVDDFDAWRKEEDDLIANKYEAIISTYADKTNEFIRRVLKLSADLFQMELQLFENVHPIDWKRTFYYKMEDDPVFLEFDPLKAGTALLPDSIVRKRILRRALSSVEDKVTRHCGRLRYEYEYSIHESFRAFQFDLNEKIDAVINHISNTLNTAIEMRRKQAATIATYVKGLQNRMDQLLNLHADEKDTSEEHGQAAG